jgi:hypothetical protein
MLLMGPVTPRTIESRKGKGFPAFREGRTVYSALPPANHVA